MNLTLYAVVFCGVSVFNLGNAQTNSIAVQWKPQTERKASFYKLKEFQSSDHQESSIEIKSTVSLQLKEKSKDYLQFRLHYQQVIAKQEHILNPYYAQISGFLDGLMVIYHTYTDGSSPKIQNWNEIHRHLEDRYEQKRNELSAEQKQILDKAWKNQMVRQNLHAQFLEIEAIHGMIGEEILSNSPGQYQELYGADGEEIPVLTRTFAGKSNEFLQTSETMRETASVGLSSSSLPTIQRRSTLLLQQDLTWIQSASLKQVINYAGFRQTEEVQILFH